MPDYSALACAPRRVHTALSRKIGNCTIGLALATGVCVAQTSQDVAGNPGMQGYTPVSDLYVVDCLLPGKVRRLGNNMVYLKARRPIRTTARDCRIRGGEYVEYDRADYRTALRVWQGRAEEGDTEAQVIVGEIYEKGLGTAPDYALAAEWYRRAAEAGNTRGQMNLAYLFEQGLGVEQDVVRALNWYRKAAGAEGDALMFASAARERIDAAREELARELEVMRDRQRGLQRLQEQARSELERLRESESDDAGAALREMERQLAQANNRAATHERRTEQLRAELERARANTGTSAAAMEDLQSRLSAATRSAANANREVEQLRVALNLARGERDELTSQLARAESRAAQYRQRAEQLRAELERAQASGETNRDARDDMQRRLAEANHRAVTAQETVAQLQARIQRGERQRGEMAATIAALEQQLDEVSELAAAKQRRIEELERARPAAVPQIPEASPGEDIDFGRYYALVVGVEKYRHWPPLISPQEDAKELAALLERRYGFNTRLLLDADREDILNALNDLRKEVREDDSVLIYYAGHGQLRRSVAGAEQGYWLPIEAQRDQMTFWLPNSQFNDQISLFEARSIFVVADSCYAGAMSTDPASLLLGGRANLSARMIELGLDRRARFVLSSGALHPTLDAGDGSHSVFARAMIEILSANDKIMHEEELYRRITERVLTRTRSMGAEQRPELRPIRSAGHNPGGRFFLVPEHRRTAHEPTAVPALASVDPGGAASD